MKLVVRHPRVQGMRLYKPPAGTDDQLGKGVALVPLTLKPYGQGEVKVDERRGYPTYADWLSPEADQAVKAYLADPRADKKVASVLRSAWQLRDAIVKDAQERQKLQGEQQILQNASEQTRENLKSIQRNKTGVDDLRKALSDRLIELDSKLAQVNKRLVELELSLNENQVRFQELLRDLFLAEPLPPA